MIRKRKNNHNFGERALIGRELRYDVKVTQFVFLCLRRSIFRETSTEMDVKNCQCFCKKQIDNNFS